jgi:hypothetical protein
MTGKPLHYIQIHTKGSHYVMSRVDLDKYRGQLQPQPMGNPCLQIINEEMSVLSILWDLVTEINVGHVDITDGKVSYRLETLYKAEPCTA